MFNRVMSGSVSTDDSFDEYGDAYAKSLARYHEFLGGLDLSRAGDLLLFFGHNFFHDAGIRSVQLVGAVGDVKLELGAWLEYDSDVEDLPDELLFDVVFRDAVWTEMRREEAETWGADSFKYGEIDGLDDRIAAAVDKFGGEFHSLTAQTDYGWIALVFRSVQAIPRDPILWARIMRDQRAVLPLWGLGRQVPA